MQSITLKEINAAEVCISRRVVLNLSQLSINEMLMLEVHYARCTDFAACDDDFFLSRLGEEGRKILLQYGNPKVRGVKFISRFLLRTLFDRVWNLREGDYRITKGEHGKPYLQVEGRSAYFNLSHTGDYIICVLSDREAGIDMEHRGTPRLEVARRFFHPHEVARLEAASPEEQRVLFFNYWAAKESYLKFTGSGLSGSLASFEVCFSGGEAWIEKEHSRLPLSLRECPIDKNYSTYLCSPEAEPFTVTPFVL